MDLRSLRYLVAVANHLSFTAAAREMNVSQPALSQQVKILEDELGIQLFVRTPKRVALTRGGELVVAHAVRTLEGAARLRDAVDAFRGLKKGKLRMAVTQSFKALHLTPALAIYLESHPEIDVTVLEWTNSAIIAGVVDGAIDLGVAFGPIEASVSTRVLYEDRLTLACSSDHAFARRSDIDLSALSTETLAVLTTEFGTRAVIDQLLRTSNVSPRRVVELDTFASILKLVQAGCCVSMMPAWSRLDGEKGVVFRPIRPAPPLRSVFLVELPKHARSPAAVSMSEVLLRQFPK